MTVYYVAPMGAGLLVPKNLPIASLISYFSDPKARGLEHPSLIGVYLIVPSAYTILDGYRPFEDGKFTSPLSGNAKYQTNVFHNSDGLNGAKDNHLKCEGCPHEMLKLLGDSPCAIKSSEATAIIKDTKLNFQILTTYCAIFPNLSEEWKRIIRLKVNVVYGKEAIHQVEMFKNGSVEVQLVPSLKKWKAAVDGIGTLSPGKTADMAALLDTVGKAGR